MIINPVYQGTYWHNFKPGSENKTDEIIRNRNRFAMLYHLTKWRETKIRNDIKGMVLEYLDHIEMYRAQWSYNGALTGKAVMLLSHEYNKSEGFREEMRDRGFQRIKPMYSNACDSWQINAQSPAHLKELLSRILGKSSGPHMLLLREVALEPLIPGDAQ